MLNLAVSLSRISRWRRYATVFLMVLVLMVVVLMVLVLMVLVLMVLVLMVLVMLFTEVHHQADQSSIGTLCLHQQFKPAHRTSIWGPSAPHRKRELLGRPD
jgi:type IV secretory pathway VirB3-like protein